MTKRVAGVACALALLVLPACMAPSIRCPDDPAAGATKVKPDFKPFAMEPKARIGSVPCMGPYTLFTTADADELGRHLYGFEPVPGLTEARRGILYTTRGGFIDIAHLRKAADWTAYHHTRFHFALSHNWQCVRLRAKEASVYHVTLDYPPGWADWSADQRDRVIDELAIRLAQRLAIMQTSWHEIATWFGYSSTPLPEKTSAFTYDDTTSHILGAQIAGMALRDPKRDYDTAVTFYLRGELARLGAVSPEQTVAALRVVEGDWWARGRVLKRQLDIGEDDGVVTPWLAPGFADREALGAIGFEIPQLDDVAGRDLSGFASVRIDPRIFVWSKMRRVLPGEPDRCDPARDFPLLMAHIRAAEADAPPPAVAPRVEPRGKRPH